jgi:hypothetical protein
MRLIDGRYVCSHCGATLPIPIDRREPHVVIRATAGKPNVRSLMLDGRELHRCELSELQLIPRETSEPDPA